MADTVVIGPRSDAETALELTKFVFSYMTPKPQSEDEILALYHKCRYEVVRNLSDLRSNR